MPNTNESGCVHAADCPFYTEKSSLESRLADHGARITNLESAKGSMEKAVERVRDSVDGLRYWIMGTLASALVGLVIQLLKK